jgi:hypothetical protein
MPTKRLAFFDYDLNEFHADHFLALLRGPLAERGFIVSSCFGLQDAPSREWAKKHNVPYAADLADLDKNSDFLIILAPDNAEQHERIAELTLPFGKPTFIDKTFAPDFATAERIFALADRYRAPVIGGSSLRYTEELNALKREDVISLQVWGGGRVYDIYLAHPLEMIVATMGAEVIAALREGDDRYAQLHIRYSGGRSANMFMSLPTPCAYYAMSTTPAEVKFHKIKSDFFRRQMTDILDFFERGEPTIDRRETLTLQWLRDVALGAAGEWRRR